MRCSTLSTSTSSRRPASARARSLMGEPSFLSLTLSAAATAGSTSAGSRNGAKRRPEHAVRVRIRRLRRRLQRQPRLPRPARTHQRHEAHVRLAQHPRHRRHLLLRPRKGVSGTGRFVRWRLRIGGNSPFPSWNTRSGGAQVLEAVLAEVCELERVRLEQCDRRGRQHHLPAVRGAHDPRGSVHVHAHVLGRVERGLAGVDADADADRSRLYPTIASLTADTAACAEANA